MHSPSCCAIGRPLNESVSRGPRKVVKGLSGAVGRLSCSFGAVEALSTIEAVPNFDVDVEGGPDEATRKRINNKRVIMGTGFVVRLDGGLRGLRIRRRRCDGLVVSTVATERPTEPCRCGVETGGDYAPLVLLSQLERFRPGYLTNPDSFFAYLSALLRFPL